MSLNMLLRRKHLYITKRGILLVAFFLTQCVLTIPTSNCPISCKCKSGNVETCKVTSSDCGKPLNSIGFCTYFCSTDGYCGFGKSYQTENSTDCFGCHSDITCDDQYITSSRSISGYDACRIKRHSMPWMVRLAYKENPTAIQKQYCGGTLISRRLVLTAEHCTENGKWKKLVAIVGDHDIITKEADEQAIEIEDHIRHPNIGFKCKDIGGKVWRNAKAVYNTEKEFSNSYLGQTSSKDECAKLVWTQEPKAIGAMRITENNNGSCYAFWTRRTREASGHQSCFLGGIPFRGYDLSILVLKKQALLSDNVVTASLPDENEDCIRIGRSLIAGGWGYGIPTPGTFDDLWPNRWSRYPWAIQQQCLDLERCDFPVTADKESFLCVGDKDKRYNSPCQADSGGPLTFSKGNNTVLFGVLSGHGKGDLTLFCRSFNKFGRVSEPKTLKWIKDSIKRYL